MSNHDFIFPRGLPSNYKDNRGGAALIPHPVIGIVKNNIDPTHTGKIEVWLGRLNDANQDNPRYWTPVRYLSPFFGSTQNTSSPDGEGKFKGNSHSYGMWATPPDIGTEVLCIFVGGDINFGYYIGCIPGSGLTHMVPATSASAKVVPNSEESETYGGASELPVTEYNDANKEKDNKEELVEQDRTVHSYQAGRLFKQGIVKDPVRGTITSSAARETPSNVFGISTPGRPYYKGGYTDESIEGAAQNEGTPDENFKVVGRKGGHSFVMDDGTLTGKNQLVRLRSGTGHMILMHDKEETMYIVHANGKTYIELNKEGAIDIYSTNSVNVRTHGDMNIHAERDINMFAKRNFNLKANENINIESAKDTSIRASENFKQYTAKKHTVKVDDAMAFQSKGDAGIESKATVYVKGGPNINLNTGTSPLTPEEVKKQEVKKHTDTIYNKSSGFTPAPNKIESINSRVPAHSPWTEANKGVDVKVDMGEENNTPQSPSSQTQAANNSAPDTPNNPTSPSNVNSVPTTSSEVAAGQSNMTSSLVSQAAVNAANTPNPGPASLGAFNFSPNQLEAAGYLKPGSGNLVKSLLEKGMDFVKALPPSVWTGLAGIATYAAFANNQSQQAEIQAQLLQDANNELIDKGIITGKESLTETGGLILAASAAGVPAVEKYVKSTTSGVSSVGANSNTNIGSVTDLISGGNYAAKLADKVSSGTNSSIGDTNSNKGSVTAAYQAILDSYGKLKPGVPQDLAAIKKERIAEYTKKYGMNPEEVITNPANLNTLIGLPGGEAAITNIVDPSKEYVVYLSKEIDALADQSLGLPASMTVASIKEALLNGTLNLETVATMGLNPSQTAILISIINSLSTGMAAGFKMPTTGVNTFVEDGVNAKLARLENSEYTAPVTNVNTSRLTTAANLVTNVGQTTENASLFTELRELQSKTEQLKQEYLSCRDCSGINDPSTIQAYSLYKENMKAIIRLQEEISKLGS